MSLNITRRTLLGAFIAASAAGTLGPWHASAAHAADSSDDIYTQLRLRYRATLVGPDDLDLSDPVIAAEARDLADSMDTFLPLVDRSAGRLGVFTDIALVGATDASVVTDTFKRLLTLATAWAVPGHKYSGDPALGNDLVEGMRTVNLLAYSAGNAEWENWWDWELGSPSRIGKILVIAHDIIPADLRQAYVDAVAWYATPGYMYPRGSAKFKPATGSNLLNICLGSAINAIVGRQPDILAQVRDHAPLGLGYNDDTADTPDGLYPDGSFLQHKSVPYTGTYGTSYISALGEVVALLGGSDWAIQSEGMAQILDGVESGFAPLVFDGLMMDAVSGREISYSDRNEASRGRGTVMTILQLSYGIGGERRAAWLSLAKGWIERSAYRDLSKPTSIATVQRIADALAPTVTAAEEPNGAVHFPVMDRSVHRGPGWAVSVSVNSPRVSRFEVTNRENLHPWHQGAGQLAMYLTGDADGQRSNNYWPTIDPYRLPGTTVDSTRQAPITANTLSPLGQGMTAYSVAGGPLDDGGRQRGSHGAVFNEEYGYLSTMRANQSWFMLGDGVVCLGAGIRGGSAAVETIVENHRLPLGTANRWVVDGRPLDGSDTAGFSTTASRPGHAALEGVAGYVFLERPNQLGLLREDRTGNWQDIKESEAPKEVTAAYSTAWIDHGSNPGSASYAYVLLPGADAAAAARYAESRNIKVVANTPTVQAVLDEDAGFLGANFAAAGTVKAGRYTLTASGPASISVLVELGKNKRMEVAVADASRTAGELVVNISLPTGQQWRSTHLDDGVSADFQHGSVTLTLIPDGSGNAHRAVLTV